MTSLDDNGYIIESSNDLSFSVSEPAEFTSIQLNPLNGTVGGQSIYQLSYKLNFPADPLCKLVITAPKSDFNLKGTVSRVTAFTNFLDADL